MLKWNNAFLDSQQSEKCVTEMYLIFSIVINLSTRNLASIKNVQGRFL